jgi:hypothetical protein
MEIRKCVVCSHEWPLRGSVEPKNCPNYKCRSIRWKDGIDNRVNGPPRFVVQVDDDRKGQFERAARAAGKTVPEWLRDLGIMAVAPPIPRPNPSPGMQVVKQPVTSHPVTALEHAARAESPIGRSVTEFLLSKTQVKVENEGYVGTGDQSAIAPATPYEVDPDDKPFKPWISELKRLQRMGEVDPGESADEERRKLDSVGFQTPKGWIRWTLEQRADYLDIHHPLAGPRPEPITAAPDGW